MNKNPSWLAQFIAQPRQMASIAQASPDLSRRMAQMTMKHLPDDGRVIEVGCGFGSVTRQLINEGLTNRQLVSIDLSERAVQQTRKLGVTALCTDARYLRYLVRDLQWPNCQAIVSSLGLLSMPEALRREILTGMDEVLAPGGCVVQYTYGRGDPTKGQAFQMGWKKTGREFTWKNLPPAYVWKWTKPGEPKL